MASPAQLDVAAAALRAQAACLASLLEPAVARAGTNAWQGPAQRQLWDRLAVWRSRLAGAQTELAILAGALEAEAARIRAAEAAAARELTGTRRVS